MPVERFGGVTNVNATSANDVLLKLSTLIELELATIEARLGSPAESLTILTVKFPTIFPSFCKLKETTG